MSSGQTIALINANAHEQLVGTGAVLAQQGNGDYIHNVVELPDTGSNGAWYYVKIPAHYTGGGLTVEVEYVAVPTANEVVLEVACNKLAPGGDDIDSAPSFGTGTTATSTVPGTSGVVKRESFAISHANAESPAIGDQIMLRVQRLGSDSGDDASGVARLIDQIHVKET